MVTIIHLSDLHIHGSDAKADNRNAKVIVKFLCEQFKARPKTKTYVVMTGDLVDDSTLKQYNRLRAGVLGPLSKHFTLLAAPGNHDYAYVGNLFNRGAPKRFRNCLGPYVKSLDYPAVTVNNAEHVLFVGLDSADACDQQWFAEGVVGRQQREALANSLEDPKYRKHFKVVYLHHHPFVREPFMALRQSGELLKVLAERVDLVLFGHKHRSEVFFGRYRIPLMLASGKVTESRGDALAFRVVEIEPEKKMVVHTEEIPGAA